MLESKKIRKNFYISDFDEVQDFYLFYTETNGD